MQLKVTWRNDRNILNNIAKGISNATDRATQEVAEQGLEYIKEHWSEFSPSSPGSPPAVKTGELDASGHVIDMSYGTTSAKAIIFDAMNKGRPYPMFLEYGTVKMLPRPFVEPALQTIMENFRSTVIAEMSSI